MIEFMKQNLEPDRLKNFCIDQIKFMQNNLWSNVWMNNEEQESVQVYACMWKMPHDSRKDAWTYERVNNYLNRLAFEP